MFMGKILLIDMDDVLVDLCEAWIEALNARYGTVVKYEDITQWEMKVAFPTLTDNQLFGILNEEFLWKRVKPKGTAVEDVKLAKELGYDVYVCTASHYKTVTNKMVNALIPYFDIDYKHIIVCHNKGMICGDYLIDDYPGNLKDSKAITFLMDTPYNQNADEMSFDFRVKSIREALAIMEEMKEMRFSE
jgi:5'(3')-deoxyribonucleotidase